MNPVAWLVEGYDGIGSHIRTVVSSKPKPDSWVTVTPLYTAPRELSDEEILEELLIPKSEWEGYKAQVCLKQVRAILKKASEK
jgi:hypothetical protein